MTLKFYIHTTNVNFFIPSLDKMVYQGFVILVIGMVLTTTLHHILTPSDRRLVSPHNPSLLVLMTLYKRSYLM